MGGIEIPFFAFIMVRSRKENEERGMRKQETVSFDIVQRVSSRLDKDR